MFTLHHANRVLHGAEWTWNRAIVRMHGEFADARKQHVLFLQHVLQQIAAHVIE
jgi:hypothetical protein